MAEIVEIPGARCAIYTANVPKYEGQTLGLVGQYTAENAEAGRAVLAEACRRLKDAGCTLAVGPMDGNTWKRYRWLTDRGTEPAFFLEPDNPDDFPKWWTASGFQPLATFFSGLNADLSVTDPRTPATLEKLAVEGITLRNIRLDRLDDELKAVHVLSLIAFAGNFLYTPISQADFLAQYMPIRPYLKPELVLFAEKPMAHGVELIGFMFGVPDLAQAQRGQPITRAIAKSMAVHPDHGGKGLGSVLIDQFQQACRSVGYSQVIHALMHEANRSRKITAHFGQPIRRYTLFGKGLL
jgi:GNAT superfamily N-acetyltransferase